MEAKHRERALEHVEDFLYDLQDQPTGLDRQLFLLNHYPHLSRAFVNRYMDVLVCMDPVQLVAAIGYPDPTGERACRNVMRRAA